MDLPIPLAAPVTTTHPGIADSLSEESEKQIWEASFYTTLACSIIFCIQNTSTGKACLSVSKETLCVDQFVSVSNMKDYSILRTETKNVSVLLFTV